MARMEAAVKFLQFITTPEAGTLWVNNVGELPAQLSAASDEEILADPILGPFSAAWLIRTRPSSWTKALSVRY